MNKPYEIEELKRQKFGRLTVVDNNGNYEPNNCRWVTQAEQLTNRRVSTA